MKRIFGLSLILFLAVSICFGQNAGTITGTVKAVSVDAALHDVSVRIVELNRAVVTDQNGSYKFAGLPPGTYTLVVHQEGFADEKQKVTLAQNSASVTQDFELRLTGLEENVTVTASGTEQSTFEAIESVSTVGSNEIAARASVGLGDVLDNEAGVSKRSAGPGASRPVIRGFDGDRVKVAADGISAGSLASQSGDHSEPIDTLALE
ncbi:MAG: TonB-dependent receptor plug domain-containing protein, partial [Acidobacteria bacterium]|nr:TonB-dependent receptor plug domain-containing protein [Acidobacteriota bacterium]